LSLGRIGESAGEISGSGIIDKTWCTKPRCWHEICYMGKVSTFYFLL